MDVLEICLPQRFGLRRGGLKRTVTTSIVVVATGLLIGPLIITIIVFRPLRGIIGNGGGSWRRVDNNSSSRSSVPTVFSSDASFSSSESSRMMTMSSPGSLRMSQLRSLKSFLANSASREVSAMKSSSSEDKERSITRAFPEELPCSKTGE
jgi:hypothetical protein